MIPQLCILTAPAFHSHHSKSSEIEKPTPQEALFKQTTQQRRGSRIVVVGPRLNTEKGEEEQEEEQEEEEEEEEEEEGEEEEGDKPPSASQHHHRRHQDKTFDQDHKLPLPNLKVPLKLPLTTSVYNVTTRS